MSPRVTGGTFGRMKPWLLVAMGGAIGATLRYGVYRGVTLAGWSSPWATLAVNLLGSMVLGWLLGGSPPDDRRLLWGTGVLGGFTTFSTFSHDAWGLARGGAPVLALSYAVVSVVGGVVGVQIGRLAAGAL